MSRHNGLILRTSDVSNFDQKYSIFTEKFKLIYIINDDTTNLQTTIDYLHTKHPDWNKYTIIQSTELTRSDIEYVVKFDDLLELTNIPSQHIYILLTMENINSTESWHQYNIFKLNNHHHNFSLALEYTDTTVSIENFQYWLTEPISFILFPTTSTTSSSTPDFIFNIFQQKSIPIPLLIIEDIPQYEQKLLYLKNISKPHYQYYSQPLQPLVEDLSMGIYKQFESDNTKYNQYQQAFELAISDLTRLKLPRIKILIIGPGTGKLIDKLWKVLDKKLLPNYDILAIEKNPICVPILNEKNTKSWNNKIQIINQDIQKYTGDNNYNLIISELIGSFGDNELCPEILSQFNQPRPDLIMIPNSYTSFLQPIYTPFKIKKISLIKLGNYYPISQPQEMWNWNHPGEYELTQTKSLTFANAQGYKISGFLGWFECTLYGHVQIQCHDVNLGNYCKSWYPIYFPIHKSKLKPNQDLLVEFNRINNGENVWYEYKFLNKVYNQHGVSYCMSLQHS
ncbi:Protein arginine N-methyltransferase 5 [Spathaspora sp. JA1]|nr:Protein arginine N-methyltransferase 5 [Spathaspora sp. JA1]